MASSSPDWLDIVVKLTPAFITLVVGGFGTYFAHLQYKLNNDKLRLELFERRLAAYESLQVFFAAFFRDGQIKIETFPLLWAARTKCRFLFGPDIQEYFELLWSKCKEMHALHWQMYPGDKPGLPVGPERSAVSDKHHALAVWMSKEMETVGKRFESYIGFAN